jgi:SagB-type dehydrogenase family enzyme
LTRYDLQVRRAALLDGLRAEGDAPAGMLQTLLAQALWAGALSDRPDATEMAPAWGPEDLLFHTASRRRADHRHRGRRLQPVSWAPAASAARSRPLSAELQRRLEGISFEFVLAQRRSVRGPAAPLAAEDLRELLCVVQAARGDAAAAPQLAYPTAGGLQVLDFHVLSGAPPALHRFDATAGALEPVAAPAGSVQSLLDEAALGWGAANGTPQALLVITARLPVLAGRYEAIAYRLALLEAGCATQVLTQAATALGIATCVLGSGDGELFARASGLPEWQQPAIAEIAIAGRLA